MRVAIFADNFFPELGGIKDSVVLLAEALAQRGHFVDFYAPHVPDRDFIIAGLPVRELDLGPQVRVHRLASVRYPISSTGQTHFVIPTGAATRLLRRNRPDIIHTQTFFGIGIEAVIASKLLGIPMIGTNHMAMLEYARYSLLPESWYTRVILPYISWYYNRCDYVTAPSQSVFPEMIEHGLRRPYSALSNPIDTRIFHPASSSEQISALKQRFAFSPHTMVFAGRIAEEKKIPLLIDALALVRKEIPDAMLALAGHGAALTALRAYALHRGVANHVLFLGTLDQRTLADMLRASDVCTISSTSETQNIVLMQAMACSVPAVVVNARALPEYVDASRGAVVQPDDPKVFADATIALLRDDTVRAEKGAHAAQYLKQFAWDVIADRWINLYTEVISKTR